MIDEAQLRSEIARCTRDRRELELAPYTEAAVVDWLACHGWLDENVTDGDAVRTMEIVREELAT